MQDNETDNMFSCSQSLLDVMDCLQQIRNDLEIDLSEEQFNNITTTATHFICKACMCHPYQHEQMEEQVRSLSSLTKQFLQAVSKAPPLIHLEMKRELVDLECLKRSVNQLNEVLGRFSMSDVSTYQHILEERNVLARYIRLIIERGAHSQSMDNQTVEKLTNKILRECMPYAMKFSSIKKIKMIEQIQKEKLPDWNSRFWQKTDDENLDILHTSVLDLAYE